MCLQSYQIGRILTSLVPTINTMCCQRLKNPLSCERTGNKNNVPHMLVFTNASYYAKNMPIKLMRGCPRIQGNLQWAVVHVKSIHYDSMYEYVEYPTTWDSSNWKDA